MQGVPRAQVRGSPFPMGGSFSKKPKEGLSRGVSHRSGRHLYFRLDGSVLSSRSCRLAPDFNTHGAFTLSDFPDIEDTERNKT